MGVARFCFSGTDFCPIGPGGTPFFRRAGDCSPPSVCRTMRPPLLRLRCFLRPLVRSYPRRISLYGIYSSPLDERRAGARPTGGAMGAGRMGGRRLRTKGGQKVDKRWTKGGQRADSYVPSGVRHTGRDKRRAGTVLAGRTAGRRGRPPEGSGQRGGAARRRSGERNNGKERRAGKEERWESIGSARRYMGDRAPGRPSKRTEPRRI